MSHPSPSPYPPTPRWVKIFGVVAIVAALILAAVLHRPGRHGPGRHGPGAHGAHGSAAP